MLVSKKPRAARPFFRSKTAELCWSSLTGNKFYLVFFSTCLLTVYDLVFCTDF